VPPTESSRPERLVLLTFQEKLGTILSEQMQGIFGDELKVAQLVFGRLDQFEFHPGDMLLALSESSLNIARKIHPDLNHVLLGQRTINQLYLHHILGLPAGQNILVVNDSFQSTMQVLTELERYDLPHTFVPFRPTEEPGVPIDWVVTVDEEPLVPAQYTNVTNVGTRALGLDTVLEIKDKFGLSTPRKDAISNYFKSLASMVGKQLGDTSNRYISNWLGGETSNQTPLSFEALVSRSAVMKQFKEQAKRLAATPNPIHISGSIGSGKGPVARMIHTASPRRDHPFSAIHCPSRPDDMLERELFGWEDGDNIYPGVLEGSHLGTVCIERLESLPLHLQERLIQVIQEQKLVRQGGKVFISLDVRLITTSLGSLSDLYNQQRISRGLFLLLQQSICHLPPLSERREDIEAIALDYLKERFPGHRIQLAPALIDLISSRRWQGDVQELYNVLSLMAAGGQEILDVRHLPYHILTDAGSTPSTYPSEMNTLITKIEEHDFLPEVLAILEVYLEGKKAHSRYGRQTVIKLLKDKGVTLTIQQLRLRLQRLQSLGLVEARKGRAGSTISRAGERLLAHCAGLQA